MYTSNFVLTKTGRLIDTSRLPRGASEYDYAQGRWVVPVGISGEDILNGRHISSGEAAMMIARLRH